MDEPEGQMSEERHFAITISRQMGSGGAYIGHLAAEELGFEYFDREILRRAAEHFGTEVGMLEDVAERSPGLIETIIKGFSYGTPTFETLHKFTPSSPAHRHHILFFVVCLARFFVDSRARFSLRYLREQR
jgi:cytidylate kinase